MHLLVPGAYRLKNTVGGTVRPSSSQCTFWCRVLTDGVGSVCSTAEYRVSMHLLVPGAYRPERGNDDALAGIVSMHLLVPGAYRLR